MSIDATIDVANRDEGITIDLRPWTSAATTVVVNGIITLSAATKGTNVNVKV